MIILALWHLRNERSRGGGPINKRDSNKATVSLIKARSLLTSTPPNQMTYSKVPFL